MGSGDYDDEPSGFRKDGKFLCKLSEYQLLQMDIVSKSQVISHTEFSTVIYDKCLNLHSEMSVINSLTAWSEVPCLVWKPKIHYRVQNILKLDPVLNQFKSVNSVKT